jgi:large subunit ribosomal protein L25
MATHTRPRLSAEPREGVRKKSAVRTLRREGKVPALLYGHGDPVTIQLSAREISDYLRRHNPGAILDLELEGTAGPALIRELDRHPISGNVIHLGFQRVDMQETLRSSVQIVIIGEDDLIQNDLVLQRQITDLEVVGRADLLPQSITVDVTGLTAADTVRIADLPFPDGVVATQDPNTVVAAITTPSVPAEVEAVLDAEEAAAAEAAELAEGEEGAEAGGEGAEETPASE